MTEAIADIIARITDALTHAERDRRTPVRLLIGNLEAAELEAVLYRPARTWRGLLGEVLFEDEEFAPKLPYPMTEAATIFGVPVERVDQPTLLGVISEDAE